MSVAPGAVVGPSQSVMVPPPSSQQTPVPPVVRRPIPAAIVRDTNAKLVGMGSTGASAAARVQAVADAIGLYTAAEVYATIDPVGTQLAIEQERGHIAQWLGVIRNVLILLPLSFTWAALWWATASYQHDLQVNAGDVNHPFLELWQDGFRTGGPFSTLFSFAHLAALDVVLFVILIVVGLWADIAVRRVRGSGREIRILLEKCAAALGMSAGQPAAMPDLAGNLAEMKEGVEQLLAGVAGASNMAANNMQRVTELMEEFQKGALAVSDGANKIVQQSNSLTTAVNGIQTSVNQMATSATDLSTQASNMRQSQDTSTQAIKDLVSQSGQVVANTDGTAKAIMTTMSGLDRQLAATQQAIQNASVVFDSTAKTVGAVVPALNQIVRTLSALVPPPPPRRPWWRR